MNKLVKVLSVALMSVGFVACGPANGQFGNQFGNQYGQNGFNQFGNQIGQNGMVGNNCISQGQQALSIGFSATGAAFNQNVGFYAGRLPQTHARSGQYGNVTLSGNGMMNQGGIMVNKTAQNGSIQLSVNPQNGAISGMIQINPQGIYASGIQATMYNNMAMNNMYPQNGMYPSQNGMYPNQNINMNSGVCVTSVGLDVTYDAPSYGGYQSMGVVRTALVYLYLSNGQVAPMPVVL
jgi:hypothetical protein